MLKLLLQMSGTEKSKPIKPMRTHTISACATMCSVSEWKNHIAHELYQVQMRNHNYQITSGLIALPERTQLHN